MKIYDWEMLVRNMSFDELIRERTAQRKAGDSDKLRFVNAHIAARSPRKGKAKDKRKDVTHNRQLNVRLPESEVTMLEIAAHLCDMSKSAFIRMAIDNEVAEVVKKKGYNR